MSSFSIYTLGCKLNYCESSHISRELQNKGFEIASNPDYILVNTCAVTSSAEKKGRNLISKLHRENPSAKIILMGCHAALSEEVLASWKGVYKVFHNADKINVVDFLVNETTLPMPYFFDSYSSHDRTRSFLKIQDGCDYHCTYCTVATARGESRSDSIENVLLNIEKIAQLGMKEVNLTGVNIGDFGRKDGKNFTQLVQAIEEKSSIERIRISSIEPDLLTSDIIDLVASSSKFMPHFHIPLQSGCNKILDLMHRHYHRELFAEKVYSIKNKMPDACIAIDVIAGYPTESHDDFMDSFHFLESLPLSYLHVFTYSRRPHTPAYSMKDQVSEIDKKDRTHQLLALSHQKKELFYAENIGKTRNVLWEELKHDNSAFGFTDNYVRVKREYSQDIVNKIIALKICENNLANTDDE